MATLTNKGISALIPASVSGPTAGTPSTSLTITPAVALSPSSTFTVNYSVLDGTTTTVTTPLTGNFDFKTLGSSTAPVAVNDLAIDTSLGNPTKFDFNTKGFSVTFTYNPAYTYTAQYAVTPAGTGVQGTWATATASSPLLVSANGSTAYAKITVPTTSAPTWSSGDTLSLRLVESYDNSTATGTSGTSASNVLQITDQVAPTGYNLQKGSGIAGFPNYGVDTNTTFPYTGKTVVGFGNSPVAGNALVQGNSYVIATLGMTNWALLGASSSTVGTVFTRNSSAITNGTAYLNTGAGALVPAQIYVITSIGTTDFTSVGAATNTVGTTFTANGSAPAPGTGTAIRITGTGAAVAAGSRAWKHIRDSISGYHQLHILGSSFQHRWHTFKCDPGWDWNWDRHSYQHLFSTGICNHYPGRTELHGCRARHYRLHRSRRFLQHSFHVLHR